MQRKAAAARAFVPPAVLTMAAILAIQAPACGGASRTGGTVAWAQWGQNAQHAGTLDVTGQALGSKVLDFPYDPSLVTNLWTTTGESAHYMTPLTDEGGVYMERKGGTSSATTYATQTWGVVRFGWTGARLAERWTMGSDWKAVGASADFWEPVFHGALANGYLYVPGAKGTLLKLETQGGTVVSRIVPDARWDDATYTVSPVTADASGHLYFTVIRLAGQRNAASRPTDEILYANQDGRPAAAPSEFYGSDVVDSFLVRAEPGDASRYVSISALVPGAPRPGDPCETTFANADLPWPPGASATPPTAACGTQRVALNAAPAVGQDGTVLLVTRAHFSSRYAYLVALTPDLSLRWAASLRDRFDDGCGVPRARGGQLEPNGAPGGCSAAAPYGVDPATNRPGAGRVLDDSSSSPVVAPDGSILYGAYTSYNYSQGHLMRFGADGAFLNAYPFGWDTTPAVFAHDGTYSLVTKDNRYGGMGSYCSDVTHCPTDRAASAPDYPEGYFITQLSPGLRVEWQYQSTDHASCAPGADGGLACSDDHPHGFEWCVNAPALDEGGTVYASSEDGWLYAIRQGGALRDRIFQSASVSEAYTPISLDAMGHVYSQNSGHLFVVGR